MLEPLLAATLAPSVREHFRHRPTRVPIPPNDARNARHFSVRLDAPTTFKLALSIPKIGVETGEAGREITHYAGEAVWLNAFGGPLVYEVIDGLEAYYYSVHAAAPAT